METKVQNQKQRQYFIDWLRILLIFSVFLFHIGMIFNPWDWHVKNDITSEYKGVLWYIMVFLGTWRMPLLVLISGAGTFYALGKRNSVQYIGERFKRLFVPLLVGIFTLVPIQVYIEKISNYDSLLSYYPHMFEGIYPSGNFSWHHLWFIAYLFFISLVFAPFIKFFKSNRFQNFKNWLAKIVSMPLGANIFLVPILISQFLLRPFFPDNTHDFVHDWAAMAYYILFFLSGFIILSNKSMMDSIKHQRRLFLYETVIASVLMFTLPYMARTDLAGDILWLVFQNFVAWACGISVIGYAKRYLNRDRKIRKWANEAIYPFYLIHQPVIVMVAYFVVKWDVAIMTKAFIIAIISFFLTVLIYWALVYPFNWMRIIFGMKALPKSSLQSNYIPKHFTKKKTVFSYRFALISVALLPIIYIVLHI